MKCPHCGGELGGENGVTKGGLSLPDSKSDHLANQNIETPKFRPRGKAREYSQAFEIAWKTYGRKEQKFEAFGVWLLRAKEFGGEPLFLTLILAALKWQVPMWETDGWKFAPYFERYLKRRKWEDERPAPPVAPAQPPSVPPWIAAERERERRKGEDSARTAAALARMQDLERRSGNG